MTLAPPPSPGARTDRSIAAAARGSAISLVGTVVGAVANMGMLVVIARRFDQNLLGVFAGVSSLFIAAGTFLQLGASWSATYFISRARALDRRSLIGQFIRISVTPPAVISVLFALLVVVFAEPLAGWFTKPDGEDDFVTMLRIGALFLPSWVVGQVLLGATRGLGSMRPTVVYAQAGRQIAQLFSVILAIWVDLSAANLMIGWSLPYALALLGSVMWLLRYRARSASDARSAPRQDAGYLENPRREFWRYAFPQSINTVAQAGLEKFDIIALGVIAGLAAQGTYLIVNRVAQLVVLAAFAFGLAIASPLASAFARDANEEAGKVANTLSAWMVVVVVPVLWLFIWFPTVILGIFGGDIADGAASLQIISVGLLGILTLGPSINMLMMSGGSLAAMIDNLIGLFINVALNLLLIPRLGINGAAIAWVVAVGLVRVLAMVQVWRRRGVTSTGWRVLAIAALVSIGFGGISAVMANIGPTGWGSLLAAAAIGAVVTGGLLYSARGLLEVDLLRSSLRKR